MSLLRIAFLILLFGLAPAAARAWVDPPAFSPGVPIEGQEIQVALTMGGCHAHLAPDPDHVSVVLDGSVVHVDINVFYELLTDQCTFGAVTRNYVLGSLPSGEYNLIVRLMHDDGPEATWTDVGEFPLVVSGLPPAAPVPGLGLLGVVLLCMTIHLAATLVPGFSALLRRR